MLSRYETGPFVTVGLFLLLVALLAFGIHMTFWEHRGMGWVTMLTALLSLFNFHKRFYRSAD